VQPTAPASRSQPSGSEDGSPVRRIREDDGRVGVHVDQGAAGQVHHLLDIDLQARADRR
jgi:hypothetical protein